MTVNITSGPERRSLAGIAALARLCPCGHCWAPPGKPCGPDGEHLARFARARRRGLLSGADVEAVLGAAPDAFAPGTLIRVETPGSAS